MARMSAVGIKRERMTSFGSHALLVYIPKFFITLGDYLLKFFSIT